MIVEFIQGSVTRKIVLSGFLFCITYGLFVFSYAMIFPGKYDTAEQAAWRASIPVIFKVLGVLGSVIMAIVTLFQYFSIFTYSAEIRDGNIVLSTGELFWAKDITRYHIESRVGMPRSTYRLTLYLSSNEIRKFNILLDKDQKISLFNALGKEKFRIV